MLLVDFFFFFFKQKTAYEIGVRLVGSEMCIRDSCRSDHERDERQGKSCKRPRDTNERSREAQIK